MLPTVNFFAGNTLRVDYLEDGPYNLINLTMPIYKKTYRTDSIKFYSFPNYSYIEFFLGSSYVFTAVCTDTPFVEQLGQDQYEFPIGIIRKLLTIYKSYGKYLDDYISQITMENYYSFQSYAKPCNCLPQVSCSSL